MDLVVRITPHHLTYQFPCSGHPINQRVPPFGGGLRGQRDWQQEDGSQNH
jgi:hypothetical protein